MSRRGGLRKGWHVCGSAAQCAAAGWVTDRDILKGMWAVLGKDSRIFGAGCCAVLCYVADTVCCSTAPQHSVGRQVWLRWIILAFLERKKWYSEKKKKTVGIQKKRETRMAQRKEGFNVYLQHFFLFGFWII